MREYYVTIYPITVMGRTAVRTISADSAASAILEASPAATITHRRKRSQVLWEAAEGHTASYEYHAVEVALA